MLNTAYSKVTVSPPSRYLSLSTSLSLSFFLSLFVTSRQDSSRPPARLGGSMRGRSLPLYSAIPGYSVSLRT